MPCVFPTNYKNKTMESCFLMDTPMLACFTRVKAGSVNQDLYEVGDSHHWGYCQESCNGELPHPASPFNLAKYKYQSFWQEYFYVSICVILYAHFLSPG